MRLKSKASIRLLAVFGAIGAWVGFVSCGSSNLDTGSASYVGPGSKWTVDFDGFAKSFELTYDVEPDGVVDMAVEGTYEEYANRVRLLTVTSATGTNAPSVGASAYGIEMPGYAFFLKPVGSSDREPIVMLQSGACPTGDFTANWIKASFNPAPSNNGTTDAFGTASFTSSGGSYSSSIHGYAFENGADLGSHAGPTGSCSNGELPFSGGGGTETMYMTSNNGALVNSDGGVIFAAPQFSGATTSDLTGTYTAVVFSGDKNAQGGASIFMGKITFSGGTGSGAQITDAESDTVGSSGPTFSLTAIADGLFSGTITMGSGSNPLNCVLSSVDGEQLLACNGAGQAASAGSYSHTFFMLGVKR